MQQQQQRRRNGSSGVRGCAGDSITHLGGHSEVSGGVVVRWLRGALMRT